MSLSRQFCLTNDCTLDVTLGPITRAQSSAEVLAANHQVPCRYASLRSSFPRLRHMLSWRWCRLAAALLAAAALALTVCVLTRGRRSRLRGRHRLSAFCHVATDSMSTSLATSPHLSRTNDGFLHSSPSGLRLSCQFADMTASRCSISVRRRHVAALCQRWGLCCKRHFPVDAS